MSIEIKDSDCGLGNIIVGRSIINEEEFVDALKKHLRQDEDKFKKYRYSLSDYTSTIHFDISNKSLEIITEYCDIASNVNPEAVVAIVAKHELLYGLAKMWEILSNKTNWEKMVFRNREDAEVWIRTRVKEKYGIDDLTFR